MLGPDSLRVISVLTGENAGQCCTDIDKLKAMKSKAITRLNEVLACADATTSVGDESWDVSRFFDAMTKLIDWLDKKCGASDELGYVQSDGPHCPLEHDVRWPL